MRLQRRHSHLAGHAPAQTMAGLALLLAAVACPQVKAAADGTIRSITLSSGGLAQVTRDAHVSGDQSLNIAVPLDQVDDILKSLTVSDPAGGVAGISLDGLAPVEETFRRMPFSPQELTSVAGLAQSLQGATVRVTSGGRTVEGIVLGVTRHPVPRRVPNQRENDAARIMPEPVAELEQLAVLTDGGSVQALALGADTVLEVQDPGLRDKLRLAAQVSGRARSDDMRELHIALGGTGERAVGLSYVVAAPVWKTAYRLMTADDARARLQAWAIFENATGEDWHKVDVTLSSGAPVALSQQLLKRYWQSRPEVPVVAQRSAPPKPDTGMAQTKSRVQAAMAARGAARAAPTAEMAAPALAADLAEPSAPVRQAQAQQGDTSATYTLPEPVDLQAGQTYTAPYLDAQVDAERVSLYQAGQASEHPVAALLLTNNTSASLPPGILTVYDKRDGYVGDANLLGIPKGESRMASFAGDSKLRVRSEQSRQEPITRMTVVDGILRLAQEEVMQTTYTVFGASDAARTVVIEQPRRPGWQFSSDALEGSTAERYRLRSLVPAGKQVQVIARESRTEQQTFALGDVSGEELLYWSGLTPDDALAQKLKHLATLKETLAKADASLQRLHADREAAQQNQQRIRENLRSVPPQSELAQRYLAMLGKEEDAIAAVQEQIGRAQDARDKARADMAAYIRALS